MSEHDAVEIDGRTGEVTPLPPAKKRYRCQLDTLRDVKNEMARVYKETRSDLLDPAVASKLVWMLSAIGKVIETSDLEDRVKALEDRT
jgi:hypothetical protein